MFLWCVASVNLIQQIKFMVTVVGDGCSLCVSSSLVSLFLSDFCSERIREIGHRIEIQCLQEMYAKI